MVRSEVGYSSGPNRKSNKPSVYALSTLTEKDYTITKFLEKKVPMNFVPNLHYTSVFLNSESVHLFLNRKRVI